MRKHDEKGFSLVELIIVIAIMAVLVGFTAPQYVRYLEKTKKTRDCSAIGTIMNACETIALDPDGNWDTGAANQITITIAATTSYSGGASTLLNKFVPASSVVMEYDGWPTIVIDAIKAVDGSVTFDISDDSQITLISKSSQALAERLE